MHHRSGRAVHDVYLVPPSHRLARALLSRRFVSDVDETALSQSRCEKKLYDLRQFRPDRRCGFNPFRAALTCCDGRLEAAIMRWPAHPAWRRLFQLDQLLGGLHMSDLIILWPAALDGQKRRSPPTRLQRRQAYRESMAEDCNLR